jgi:hypothetical protein
MAFNDDDDRDDRAGDDELELGDCLWCGADMQAMGGSGAAVCVRCGYQERACN